jgi:hypothetical protein
MCKIQRPCFSPAFYLLRHQVVSAGFANRCPWWSYQVARTKLIVELITPSRMYLTIRKPIREAKARSRAMLCYASLRYATLRYATLRYATLRYATLRYAMLCYAMLCYAMHVCTYVRMYVCTYVRMYVCTYVCMYVRTYVCMYVRTYVLNVFFLLY